MIRYLIRARYLAFAAVLALLAWLIVLDRHVQYEQSITSFFAADDPIVADYQRASAAFGNDNVVFVCYDDPGLLTAEGMDRVAELARALGPNSGDPVLRDAVARVESLDAMPQFWQIDDNLIRLERLPRFLKGAAVALARRLVAGLSEGRMTIGAAVRAAGPRSRADLKRKITNHPLLQGTVVDPTGRATAAVVRLKGMAEQDPKATVARLRAAADDFARRYRLGRPALVGPPVLLADGFSAIEADGQRLAIVGMALIGLVTLSATRSLWWAVVPILSGWVVWLAAEAVMATFDLRLSLSGGPLVAQIIVLTMPAASHLALHFRDDQRRHGNRRQAARFTIGAVTTPILWCSVTGALGYGALLTSDVVPILQFGAILAVCTLIASVLTLLISPIAMLPPFPLEYPVRVGSTSGLSRRLDGLTVWVTRHPGAIVLSIFVVVPPVALGMFRLQFESNYINAFKPRARVVQDYRFAESRLGGIGLISLVVPAGRTIEPESVAKFRDLDARLAGLKRSDGQPAIARAISLAEVLDPDGRLGKLGAAKAKHALATKVELIDASPQADLLGGFWDREGGHARVVVRIKEQQEAAVKGSTFNEAVGLARRPEFFGPKSYLTGLSYLLTQTTRGVMASSWTTFVWSAISILLMLTLAFRGPRLAILAMVPTLLAVGLVLGLMGWSGIRLDMATALVASVALGLSVDDTFHCLLQFRRHRQTEPFLPSLFASYAVTGPGVLLSSLAVAAGFAVLRFSQFVPFSNFGTMVGIATLGSSFGNLILLPACLTLGARWTGRLEPAEPATVAT